ncbi:chromosomal replication initiator DnaA [Bradyrhizobium sp. LHD-71]|uniref:chromosomal replication initiator DnaA n=1 Tax=Bradyrhizobium sp. LHD-71 TaxID=3072141 RepID=UPI00281069B1|nr:chromosomal replication initiator DnaA [Bradyrhizobium sp. LHD-71]MDQ8729901.1 chromosomal replication initiator DnaA [Bradyrhizobium sp. LHD-71]
MTAGAQPRQLAFKLPHAESLSREDFLEGPPNAAALELVDRWPKWPSRVVMLVGDSGSGKSHLAAIWAANAGARSTAARALTAGAVPGALATGALVVEDVAPADIDERALFHLLNLARQEEVDVLMTARTLPAGWTLELRDLQSRLRAVPVVTLAPPDDALLRALIVKLCMDRQLSVDEALVNYLASRIERSYVAARKAIELLDAEALRLRRPVTRALASELFRGPAA